MSEKPWILGISASHNGAFCLLHGGDIHIAIQEERLTGFKRARVNGARPALSLGYCLQAAGITASDLSIVLSCQRSARAEENDIWMQPAFSGLVDLPRLVVPHHLAHAASVFAASGYDRAAVLVADGLGSPLEDLLGHRRIHAAERIETPHPLRISFEPAGRRIYPRS